MKTIIAFIEDRRLGFAAIGALAIVAGSILPWIRVSQPLVGITTGYGLQDDGKVTIVFGALALALIVAHARLRHRDLAIGAAALAAASTVLAALYLADLNRNAARVVARLLAGGDAPVDPGQLASFPARPGPGVYVIFAGTALVVATAIALTIRGPGTSEPTPRASA